MGLSCHRVEIAQVLGGRSNTSWQRSSLSTFKCSSLSTF